MADKTDWEGGLGADWARNADVMERMLGPFGEAAMDAVGDLKGASVLDLGCGGGDSAFRLARRVGKNGAVIGLDVSPDLIALAAARRSRMTGDAARVGFLCADAAKLRADRRFDALVSQFGGMFFDHPIQVYADLRRTLKPGAPMAIACWRTPRENDWAMLPLNAARDLLPPAAPAVRGAPGPFGWSEPDATFAPILARAGWSRISWRELNAPIELGAGATGADGVERATTFAMEIGPLASRLRSVGARTRETVRSRVREAMAARAEGNRKRVVVNGACWLVTATA